MFDIRIYKRTTYSTLISTWIHHFVFNTDNEAPIVYSPNNVPAMNVDPGMADAIVTWSPMPSANDTVDGPIPPSTIVCEVSPGNVVMSGDRFLVGTTQKGLGTISVLLFQLGSIIFVFNTDNEAPIVYSPNNVLP